MKTRALALAFLLWLALGIMPASSQTAVETCPDGTTTFEPGRWTTNIRCLTGGVPDLSAPSAQQPAVRGGSAYMKLTTDPRSGGCNPVVTPAGWTQPVQLVDLNVNPLKKPDLGGVVVYTFKIVRKDIPSQVLPAGRWKMDVACSGYAPKDTKYFDVK
jgi:hypothetical protein